MKLPPLYILIIQGMGRQEHKDSLLQED